MRHARRLDELHAQPPPTWGLPTEKTKSKERNHSYNPAFLDTTRNESAEATRNHSEKEREVMEPG
jgi:hypothetical protein